MSEQPVRALVDLLRSPVLRCRTGIILLSQEQLGTEPDIAARLGLDAIDYTQVLRDSLPKGTVFVSISAETEAQRLDRLASRRGGADCVLIYNIDLALAKLETSERQYLWWELRDFLAYRPRALLIAMPAQASQLLPEKHELDRWRGANRLAILTDTG